MPVSQPSQEFIRSSQNFDPPEGARDNQINESKGDINKPRTIRNVKLCIHCKLNAMCLCVGREAFVTYVEKDISPEI